MMDWKRKIAINYVNECDMVPSVVAIVLNWNRAALTRQCLKSLEQADFLARAIVVDNGSTDESVRMIRTEFPDAILVESVRNLGFAEGNNLGLKKALTLNADFVLLLNNDAVIDKSALGHLLKAFELDSELGIAMAKIYIADDPKRIWSLGGAVNRNTGETSSLATSVLDIGQFQEQIPIDYPVGCAMMAKVEVIREVGLFWSPYFSYYEDTELGVRVRDIGYKIMMIPEAKVWHNVMSTLGSESPYATYLLTRNRFYFVRRNRRNFIWHRDGLQIVVWYTRQVSRFLFKHRSFRRILAVLFALFDFCVGNTGSCRLNFFHQKR